VSPRGLYRAPALVPLSRDHHEALVQALLLRRSAGRPAAALAFLDFHRAELEGHMADEEDVVLPAAETVDPLGTARIREEHGEIRGLATALAAAVKAGEEIAATMESLSRLLHDHVRYEERVFFMGLQEALPGDALESMGAALEAHRAARGVAAFCRVRSPQP
jgi:iron-sulfur cluster repair protein YtfE (RIC family)